MSEHGDGDGGSQRSGASGLSETSSQRADSKFLKKRSLGSHAADGEETDLLEQRRNIQEGVFACMYTLVKQSALSHWKYVVLKIALEFLMNFAVAFNPTIPAWDIDTSSAIYKIIRWTIWRVPIVEMHGYHTYVVVMYVMAAAVFLSVLGLAWLTLAMRKQEQSSLLRKVAIGIHVVFDTMYVMCYASFFDYFTFMADCNFLHDKKHMYFDSVDCLAMPHLLHMFVALSTALLFLCVTALMVVASSDLDPASKGYLASPAVHARLKVLAAKAVFVVCANCLDSNFKMQSILMVVAVALTFYWNLKEMPFYRRAINVVWTALWAGVLYTVLLLPVMAFSKDHSAEHAKATTQNVLYGIFPVIFGSMFLIYGYVRWVTRAARKFVGLPSGTKLRKVHAFESVHEVERLARVMRRFNSDGDVQEEAAVLGDTIIKAGLQCFPGSPYLLILYANFVLEVRKDGPAARTQLQLAGKQSPSLVEKYQIFCTNEASKRLKDSQEGGMDLQAYIEFKRNFRAVLRVHREVLVLQAELWQMCMRPSLKVAQIDDALEVLDAAATRAHQVYRRVLERYPTNGKLLRCYGKFLEDVRSDQAAAARAYSEANRSGGGNALLALDLGAGSGSRKPDFITSMSLEDDAVVVIDAEGTIMMVSQAVQDTFGYAKAELEGANVSVLMPQPFSQRHPGYLQRYVSGGEPQLLDSVREVVALHKERYVFPVMLCVTKLSGVGADSVFLGVIRPQQTSLTSMRVWVCPNGTILCSDQQFSSAIGYIEGELVGHSLSSLLSGPPWVVEHLLERCRVATPEQLASDEEDEVVTAQMLLLHRFLEPVPMEVTVRMAGTDGQRVYVLHCRRTDGQDGSLIAVDSHMRIRFASAEVGLMLGYSMCKLASMRLDQLLPPPFNTMHARWLRDPPHDVSPASCRSGVVVHMLTEAGTQVAVRLKIRTDVEAGSAVLAGRSTGAGTLYIVQVAKLPANEAFREKRLTLTTDFTGRVLAVSEPQSTLFGFSAASLLGTCLSDSIDMFAQWRERSGEGQMQLMLLALIDKEQEMPGTSWRIGVHAPPSPHEGELPALPGHVRIARVQHSHSACLQVELVEDAAGSGTGEGGTGAAGAGTASEITGSSTTDGSRLHVILWRRDLLSGVLELDDELVIRRASPLTGLITGVPTSFMLRKPLSRFLDLPPSASSWNSLVQGSGAHAHAHAHPHAHKKSALKPTSDRGTISPIMALIGPHPDSGTMRLMVQGVQMLGLGGRPKVTLTMHPDTMFVGAHANIMRVLRLDGGTDGSGSHQRRSTDGAVSVFGGRSTRAVSPAPVAVRSRSLRVAEAAARAADVGTAGGEVRPGSSSARQLSGLHGSGDGGGGKQNGGAGEATGGEVKDGDGRDGDDGGKVGDGDDDDEAAEPVSLHRQTTSKSEFVEQWVRSLSSQVTDAGSATGRHHHHHHHHHDHGGRRHLDVHQESGLQGANGPENPTNGAAACAGAPHRSESNRSGLLAMPIGLPQAGPDPSQATLPPCMGSQLETIPEALTELGGDGTAAVEVRPVGKAGAEHARRTVSSAAAVIDALVSKLPSRGDVVKSPEEDGGGRGEGGGPRGSGGKKGEDDDDKSDRTSENGDSSIGDGSQAASAYSGTSDQTSAVSEAVIDARRGRLLKALNRLLLGPSLMNHLNRLRISSYLLLAVMFFAHVVSYIVITSLISDQHDNIYIVFRQAMAMDRSQLTIVRMLLGTFCGRGNVSQVSICSRNLNYTMSRLTTNTNLMEEYHQGVYLGFDTAQPRSPAAEVYRIWTSPTVGYQVYLDTTPPQVVTQYGGAWKLGNRFLAAARETLYLLPRLRENYKFHRTFSFLLNNGLGPLFEVYADSLDHLVEAAWTSIKTLRMDLLILVIVEALLVQVCCSVYEMLLVHRVEAARTLGVLAIVGLPGPVLRQMATSDNKIINDSDDEVDDNGSVADSDNEARGAPPGGGGSAAAGGADTGPRFVQQQQQQPMEALPALGSADKAAAQPRKVVTPPDDEAAGRGAADDTAGTGLREASKSSGDLGDGRSNVRKGSKKTATRGSANARGSGRGSVWGSQRMRVNGKTLQPSYWNLSRFMVPLLAWNIAVVVVYMVTFLKLNGMQAPLASLNMASRVTYRYTRVRAIATTMAIQDDAASREVWRQLLSTELDTFESEYDALMYGGLPTSMLNATFRHEVPAGTFASSSFAQTFFRSKGCLRLDQSTCFQPGDTYYEVTHNGLDPMVRRMLTELRLMTEDDDADVSYNSTRMQFIGAVGSNDLYDGLQQGAQLFVDYSINQYNSVAEMHTILLIVSVGLLLAFFFFVLWPHNTRMLRDAARQSALLSLVPAEMDVRTHVRAVLKRAAAGGRGRSNNKIAGAFGLVERTAPSAGA